MTNVHKFYFFPPQWDFEVGGLVQLGNIIKDPKRPDEPLNDEKREALPALAINTPKPQFEVKIAVDSSNSIGAGVSLAQLFGFDLKAERKKATLWTIKADQVLTQEIRPKDSYVEKCFLHNEVKAYLEKTKFRKDLYMIIGIKAASSATVASEDGKTTSFLGKVSVNPAAASGVPVDVHAQASTSNDANTKAEFGKSEFILAYRLRKITYLKTQRVKNNEDYDRGAVLDRDAPTAEIELIHEAKFLRLEQEDTDHEEFNFPAVTATQEVVDDEEGEFQFVVPEEIEE